MINELKRELSATSLQLSHWVVKLFHWLHLLSLGIKVKGEEQFHLRKDIGLCET